MHMLVMPNSISRLIQTIALILLVLMCSSCVTVKVEESVAQICKVECIKTCNFDGSFEDCVRDCSEKCDDAASR